MKASEKKSGLNTYTGIWKYNQLSDLIDLLGNMDPSYNNPEKEKTPNNPQKDIPAKPDKNPDPTITKPGGNEPKKNDPTRIEEPRKPIRHVLTNRRNQKMTKNRIG